ncbi:MAG TPA: hypothetical protein VLL52_12830 [Anaerolineae bacterium]|nr:hypothetical protein [Anaerolineae bacterium]
MMVQQRPFPHQHLHHSHLFLFCFTLFILFCLPTTLFAYSCSDTPTDAYQLFLDNKHFYVRFRHDPQSAQQEDTLDNTEFARYSPANGIWYYHEFDTPLALTITQQFNPNLPTIQTKCLTRDPNICYQIKNDAKIYQSTDGGQTWGIAWQHPFGRQHFITWLNQRQLINCAPSSRRFGPFDLAILETGNTYFVAATFGNEGMLFRDHNGHWLNQSTYSAQPTRSQSIFPATIFYAYYEIAIILSTLWVLSILTYRYYNNMPLFPLFGLTILLELGLIIAIITPILYLCLIYSLYLGIIVIPIAWLALWFHPISIIIRWQNHDQTPDALNYWLFTYTTILILTILIINLWTNGIIPHYYLALTLITISATLTIYLSHNYLTKITTQHPKSV